MVHIESVKVFHAECGPKMCSIFALIDWLMVGNNCMFSICRGKPVK